MPISQTGSNVHRFNVWPQPLSLSSPWMMAGLVLCLLACPMPGAEKKGKSSKGGTRADPVKRAAALKRVCEKLGIGPGKAIADVGCGNGADTMTFAEVVGANGRVYAEEIEQKPLDEMTQKARGRNFNQVVPVLGASEDPRLPDATMDMIYMHQVFHHFARPMSMLSNFWADLKSGGCLVIVDRQKGPQREWVDLAEREKKHFWIGETTVVRQAREACFLFDTVLDELWVDKEPFVLVFRKPTGFKKPAGDPDLPSALNGRTVVSALPRSQADQARLLFVGMDHGRSVLPALQQKLKPKPRVYDVMLEEWTTCKDELPPDAGNGSSEILRTAEGDLPALTNCVLNAAVIADGYSRLWDPLPLLRRLHQTLRADGYVAILDRKGPDNESRRLAGHHRRIAPGLVKSDLEQAGFELVKELKAPAKDRFFLLFRPRKS